MLAMAPRLDARSVFFRPPLGVCIFSTLGLEIFRNRFSCHGRSGAEPSRPIVILELNGSGARWL